MTGSALDAGSAFDPEAAAARVAEALLPLADAARAGQEKRYLKSDYPRFERYTTFTEAVRGLPEADAATLRSAYATRTR